MNNMVWLSYDVTTRSLSFIKKLWVFVFNCGIEDHSFVKKLLGADAYNSDFQTDRWR